MTSDWDRGALRGTDPPPVSNLGWLRGVTGAGRSVGDIAVDFGAGDTPLGIEILNASRLFDPPDSPSVELQDVASKVAP